MSAILRVRITCGQIVDHAGNFRVGYKPSQKVYPSGNIKVGNPDGNLASGIDYLTGRIDYSAVRIDCLLSRIDYLASMIGYLASRI